MSLHPVWSCCRPVGAAVGSWPWTGRRSGCLTLVPGVEVQSSPGLGEPSGRSGRCSGETVRLLGP